MWNKMDELPVVETGSVISTPLLIIGKGRRTDVSESEIFAADVVVTVGFYNFMGECWEFSGKIWERGYIEPLYWRYVDEVLYGLPKELEKEYNDGYNWRLR